MTEQPEPDPLDLILEKDDDRPEETPNLPPQPPLGLLETVQEVNTKIRRQDVLEHPAYNKFKHIMTYYVGAPLALQSILGIGFVTGRACSPAPVTPTVTRLPAVSTTQTVSVPGIDRLATSIDKLADSKTATTTTKLVVPTKVETVVPGMNRLTSAVEKLAEKPPPVTPERPKSIWDSPKNR